MPSMSFWKPGSSATSAATAISSSVIVDEGGAGGAEAAPASQFNFSRKPLDLQRQALPIARHRRQILYAIEKYPVVIIVGETGEGGGGRGEIEIMYVPNIVINQTIPGDVSLTTTSTFSSTFLSYLSTVVFS